MSTQQLQLVCDNTGIAGNYKLWAKPISDWFRTAGYTNTGDTNQLNGNGGGTSGWTALGNTAPGSGAFFYEIFQSPDTPTFYVKVEYGNVSGANCPSLRLTLGTGPTTANNGTLTGYVTAATSTNLASITPPSTTTQYECNFHRDDVGNSCRIAVMMWRNGTNNCQQIFAIERSIDSDGTTTSDYVTLFAGGQQGSNYDFGQTTIVFGVGVAPIFSSSGSWPGKCGLITCVPTQASVASSSFQNSLVFDTAHPLVGWVGRACTVIGAAPATDIADGVTFQITRFGGTITYMPGKTGPFAVAGPNNTTGCGVCMRYD